MACDSRIHRTAINSKVKLRGNYTWKMYRVKLKQEHQQKSLSTQCPDVRKAVEMPFRLLLHSVFVKHVFCSRDTPNWTVSWKENLWDWNSFISQTGRPCCCPPSNMKALMAIQGFLQAGSLSSLLSNCVKAVKKYRLTEQTKWAHIKFADNVD